MLYGVTRVSGRGIPKCIIQKELTHKTEIANARGTLKVSRLVGDRYVPGLIALSLYDSKPFYMLSNACECVKWVPKKRKVWYRTLDKYVEIVFHRLNIVDDYNVNMNNVDIADQLRGSYRFDHWMRKRKWWWSMWFGVSKCFSLIPLFCIPSSWSSI